MGILKKIKKTLKKVAKPALGIGGALLAAKLLSGKGRNSTNAKAIKAMTSNDAYNDDTMPMNLSETAGPYKSYGAGNPRNRNNTLKNGGSAGKKSKPKSIGKALRGGGKVMR